MIKQYKKLTKHKHIRGILSNTILFNTLGMVGVVVVVVVVLPRLRMVGVVHVLDADAHNTSRGPKVQIFNDDPHFSFFQNNVGCPPYPYKNFERKSCL